MTVGQNSVGMDVLTCHGSEREGAVWKCFRFTQEDVSEIKGKGPHAVALILENQ